MVSETKFLEPANRNALWMVTKKDKLFAVNLILILLSCLNEKFVTVHNKCSKIPPSTSTNFANRVRRSGVVR